MANSTSYSLDWHSGASAVVELFNSGKKNGRFLMKYTPPFRHAIHPRVQENEISPEAIDHLNDRINKLYTTQSFKNGGAEGAIKSIGGQLTDLILNGNLGDRIKRDLERQSSIFLEIGLEEKLMKYPWEFMHDGKEFLSLKHAFGRFVNSSKGGISTHQYIPDNTNLKIPELSVLIISVPSPDQRKINGEWTDYLPLPMAEIETAAIKDSLNEAGVKPLVLEAEDANYDNVYSALKKQRYHIIHFNGHANFNKRALVLKDRDMSTGEIASFYRRKSPIIFFLNACETAKTGNGSDRQNIFGLATPILQSGSYLLGIRSKIKDNAAEAFATGFYSSLVNGEKTLGNAVISGREACRDAAPDDPLSWASYILYGDPRVYFRKEK